jgi:predicted membrane protein
MANGPDFDFDAVVADKYHLWPYKGAIAASPQGKGIILIFGIAAIQVARIIIRGGNVWLLICGKMQVL